MQQISLDGKWSLTHCSLGSGENLGLMDKSRWNGVKLTAQVPGQVHTDLVRQGRISEPLYGVNSKDCLWMEKEEWWHQRTFRVPKTFKGDRVELEFQGLDTVSDVWLNGEKIAHHENMLRPLVVDVTDCVRYDAVNTLVVRTDPGLGLLEGKDGERYKSWGPETRISCVRRSQFTLGWDWATRLATTGIWRGVRLRSYKGWILKDLHARTALTRSRDKAIVKVSVAAVNLSGAPKTARLRAVLTSPDGKKYKAESKDVKIASGAKELSVEITVANPQLWWPRPLGDQPLYELEAYLVEGKRAVESLNSRVGLRTVEVVREPLEDGGESFVIAINGEEVFCKGANWVPADSIVSRVTKEKYRKLVDLAVKSNMNMFRIWGGGIFEDDAFYEACDEMGVMIWHDFMYACAFYPDDDDDFAEEAKREAESAVTRLRNHPSIVLWCGNNENDWFDYNARTFEGKTDPFFGGRKIYHEILPDVCSRLDPDRPYWPSSPYGTGDPNAEHDGDKHAWNVSILNPDMKEKLNYRNYLKERGKFNSEYGMLAPPVKGTLETFLDKKDIHPRSEGWKHHNNFFEKQNIQGMLKMFYRDPKKLTFDEYLLAAQMIQAEGLRLSIDAWRSRKFDMAGALFWMYSDCWGAVGWTVVDYYLNKKPSWYYVRDANAPLRVAGWYEDGLVVHLINDTLAPFTGKLITEVVGFDGVIIHHQEEPVIIPANVSVRHVPWELPKLDKLKRRACVILKLMEGKREISRSRVFLDVFKNLKFPESTVTVKTLGNKMTFETDGYAWMVHIEIPTGADVSDNAFDLIKGEPKTVTVKGADAKKLIIRSLSPSRIKRHRG